MLGYAPGSGLVVVLRDWESWEACAPRSLVSIRIDRGRPDSDGPDPPLPPGDDAIVLLDLPREYHHQKQASKRKDAPLNTKQSVGARGQWEDKEKAREAQRRSVEARCRNKLANEERERVVEELRRKSLEGMPPHEVFKHLAEHEFPEVAYALFQKAKAGDGQSQRLITEQLLGKPTQRVERSGETTIFIHPLLKEPIGVETSDAIQLDPSAARELAEST
jgi:hypothetical protein